MNKEINRSDWLALERTKLANERTFLAYFRTFVVILSSALAYRHYCYKSYCSVSNHS